MPAAEPPPLTLAELDDALARIGGFEPRPLVAVATSGGPDSLALAILADRWARARGGVAWAVIVDHRLRPESAAEADTVAGWLTARGISHAVLVWRGDKPATGIQEVARAARYRLLAEWCGERGCLHLLTAHHRDDQAETYLIRRRAGSGAAGLAGMSAVRELPQMRIVRPLLGVAKARLVALLDAESQDYLRDPSNRNPMFERARLRLAEEAAACAPRGEGVTSGSEPDEGRPSHILGKSRAYAAARVARERAVAALLAHTVSLHPAGFALLDPAPLIAAGELGEQVLGRVAAVLGGAVYPLRRERISRLHEALGQAPLRPRTLGGCRFVPWRGRILVLREEVRAAPPLTLAPGTTALWDRRFCATLPGDAGEPVTVGALGAAGVRALPAGAFAKQNPLPRLVFPVLLAVWDGDGLAAVPHLLYQRSPETRIARFAFRPPTSLCSVGFTVV